MLATAIATQLGYYPQLMYPFFVLSMVAFYCTHWLCHVTHTMVFGKIDVSEAQWTMILVHSMTAIYGQRFWQTIIFSLLGFKIQLVHVIAFCTYGSLIRSIIENAKMAMLGLPTPLEKVGINIPRRSSVIQPLIPLGLLMALGHLCYLKGLFHVSLTIFTLTFGFSFAKLTMKLVMMNISHGDMDIADSSLVVPFMLAVNSWFPLLSPETALLCGLIYNIMDSLRFFTYSSWDLRDALDVNIFTIKYPVGHPKNRCGDNGFYLNGLNTPKVIAAWNQYQKSMGNIEHAIHED